MYIKNIGIPDEEIPERVTFIWHLLSNKYKYTARLSSFWEMLAETYGKKEFEILDFNTIQNGPFESYLIDEMIRWQHGEDIDFSTIASSVIETGDFTAAEKFLMTGEENDLEMRLWAIYLTVSRPIY